MPMKRPEHVLMNGTATTCIIGAGASGLAVAKTFVERGIPFDLLERESDLGGLWNAGTNAGLVYESTHLVSSRDSTGWADFPMKVEAYPDYPSHERVLGYFRDYAAAFGIGPHLRFNTSIERVTPRSDGAFNVQVAGETAPRRYDNVVVASGHHEIARQPTYPGTFTGEVMHSKDYRSSRQLRDKRLLVVGAGNSACDIIRDGVHASGAKVVMSMRRPTWFVPKFMLGFPTHDVVAVAEWIMTPLPRVVKRWAHQLGLWVLQGPPWRYYLPQPTHWLDQAHPTMSDDIPRFAAHGRLIVKPMIARFEGRDVVFVDGTRETADLIVYATGYEPTIPFLDRALYRTEQGRAPLYLSMANAQHQGMFFAGLVQANGSIWRLAAAQGEVMARTILAKTNAPKEHAAFYARAAAAVGAGSVDAVGFVASERHTLEANYYDYARALKREARRFRAAAVAPAATRSQMPRGRPVAAE
jgi:dimethylaniline monooxygenase (N-oxide forming)